ncbi:hypothetical protein [Bacillus velezensis]|uniref:hypothetical protein n=1 Tax=Bacillus velezensis TaxID=492670 RepID=UPI0033981403
MIHKHADFFGVTLDFFVQQSWSYFKCSMCGQIILYKKSYKSCPKCNRNKQKQRMVIKKKSLYPHHRLSQSLTSFLEGNQKIQRKTAIPIWKTSANHVFVGSGLEYMFRYMYHDLPLPEIPVFIVQPSIRLRTYSKDVSSIHRMGDENCSFGFVNISILRQLNNTNEFPVHLDSAVTLLSASGLHVNRMSIVIDTFIYSISKRYKSHVIRFYIDQVEVGDYIAITDNITETVILETGFGLERLTACRDNIKYIDVLSNEHCPKDADLILILQFFVLFTMSAVPFNKKSAWFKAKGFALYVSKNLGSFDTFLSHRYFYQYWLPYVYEPLDQISSYLRFLDLIEGCQTFKKLKEENLHT